VFKSGADSWEHITGGSGDKTVVIIPGGGGTAESMFSINAALESHCRVVSLTTPGSVVTVDHLVEGLCELLDSLHVERAVFLGHSLGGIAVQAFALLHPQRVAGLILSNTGIYLGARARILPFAASLMSHLPHSMLVRQVNSQMHRLLSPLPAGDAEFWRAFIRDEVSQPPAAERIKGQFALMGDVSRFLLNAHIDAGSLPVQIIAAEDDRGFTKREIEFLRRIYPNSRTTVFTSGGHLSFLTRSKEYVDAVQQCVDRL